MPLTRPMPDLAKPIVRKIRESVERPQSMPRATESKSQKRIALRWNWISRNKCCPMGMLPQSKDPVPCMIDDFTDPPGSMYEIRSFSVWWDTQDDPEAAVAAVWDEPLE